RASSSNLNRQAGNHETDVPSNRAALHDERDGRSMLRPLQIAGHGPFHRVGAALMELGMPDRPAHAEPPRQNIIWLASYPKSGNTWVRVFVHNLLNELSGVAEAQDINRMDTHTLWEFAARPFERVLGKSLATADQTEVAAAR